MNNQADKNMRGKISSREDFDAFFDSIVQPEKVNQLSIHPSSAVMRRRAMAEKRVQVKPVAPVPEKPTEIEVTKVFPETRAVPEKTEPATETLPKKPTEVVEMAEFDASGSPVNQNKIEAQTETFDHDLPESPQDENRDRVNRAVGKPPIMDRAKNEQIARRIFDSTPPRRPVISAVEPVSTIAEDGDQLSDSDIRTASDEPVSKSAEPVIEALDRQMHPETAVSKPPSIEEDATALEFPATEISNESAAETVDIPINILPKKPAGNVFNNHAKDRVIAEYVNESQMAEQQEPLPAANVEPTPSTDPIAEIYKKPEEPKLEPEIQVETISDPVNIADEAEHHEEKPVVVPESEKVSAPSELTEEQARGVIGEIKPTVAGPALEAKPSVDTLPDAKTIAPEKRRKAFLGLFHYLGRQSDESVSAKQAHDVEQRVIESREKLPKAA